DAQLREMRLITTVSAAFVLALLSGSNAYKLLVFNPSFSQSINNFLGNIADTLVDAGHDVTSLIPIVNPSLRDGSHKSEKIYVQSTDEVTRITESMNFDDADFFYYNDFDPITSIPFGRGFCHWFNSQCKGVLDERGLVEKLKNEKFDVMIVESFDACGIALSHLIKVKSLITTAGSVPMGPQGEEMGLEPVLSYNPNALISHIDVHSMLSRFWNIYADLVFKLTWYTSRTEIDALFRERFGNEYPAVKEIASDAAFSFINSELLIDFATPMLSRVILIGGIGAKEPRKLDKELDRIVSLRNKTVLISFGSIVTSHTLPIEVKDSIVKTVSQFPEVTFLWKYEKPDDEFAKAALSSTPNLQILLWTPQNDLLADERLTAFITHGGMASTQETALRGKPGLFIPFIGDQPRNSGMMEKNGVGKVYSKYDLSDSKKLIAAVKDLLENESYRENAVRIAAMIRKKPFSAREQLVKTVEFAAQFGPSSALRPKIFDMTWIEFHNADLICVFILVILVSLDLAFYAIRVCLRRFIAVFKVKNE
ncbi:hypothetical protein PFISCL1PPCAC_6543, partial [Pristionchus fissidentatus]